MPTNRVSKIAIILYRSMMIGLLVLLLSLLIDPSILVWGTFFGLIPLSTITGLLLCYETWLERKEEKRLSPELFHKTLFTFAVLFASIIFLGILLSLTADNFMSLS